MAQYQFDYILYPPELSTDPEMYMAEIPALPGCQAWGNTEEETIEFLKDIAANFVELYGELDLELPQDAIPGDIDRSRIKTDKVLV
ncbi:MAG: type II toxin-antitoxin system HicB family antitoxin [Chloroflexi bacterium]|nr:type II toxin-antitoxin system HicB family antitoxin [Chloroflexota bacterium]